MLSSDPSYLAEKQYWSDTEPEGTGVGTLLKHALSRDNVPKDNIFFYVTLDKY